MNSFLGMNPRWVAPALFFIVGLIWSGGHIGWLIALGIWTFIGMVTKP